MRGLVSGTLNIRNNSWRFGVASLTVSKMWVPGSQQGFEEEGGERDSGVASGERIKAL